MKKKLLLIVAMIMVLTCILAISVSASGEEDPYASYYEKVYIAADETPLALYEREGDTYYPLAWFYNSETSEYEAFRVGTEVIFTKTDGVTPLPVNTDFTQNTPVVFQDTTKTYTMANLILVNTQGSTITHFSGSWTNLPIQAIYCSVGARYVNGNTFNKNQSLAVFDIPRAHSGAFNLCGASFANCSKLKELYIPKNAWLPNSSAFEYSALETVVFADIWEPINYWNQSEYFDPALAAYTFNSCKSLKSVTLPSNLVTIGQKAFHDCDALTSFTIPDTVTLIDDYAFQNCDGLSSITFSNAGNLVTIDQAAFENCTSLASIVIPNGVTTLGNCAFKGCKALKSITFPATLATISGDQHFWNTALEEVIGLENTQITRISQYMFRGLSNWKPERLVLPNTVTQIGENGLADVGMTEVVLGAGMTTIGTGAFTGCKSLKAVYMPATITSMTSSAFDSSKHPNVKFFLVGGADDAATIKGLETNATLVANATIVSIDEYDANATGSHIVYGLKSCDTFYNGVHIFTSTDCIADCTREGCLLTGLVNKDGEHNEGYLLSSSNEAEENVIYTEMMYRICQCSICKTVSSYEEIGVLFTINGYSSTTGAIMQGFQINKDAIEKYKTLSGKDVKYGVLAASGKVANIYLNGFTDNVVSVDFTNRSYAIMEMKIYGIGENHYETALYCCGYILVDGNIIYMDEGMADGATMPTKVTYNSLANEVVGPSTLDAIVPNDEE